MVRAELRSFAGRTLLIVASCDAEQNRNVFQSDASGTVASRRGGPRGTTARARLKSETKRRAREVGFADALPLKCEKRCNQSEQSQTGPNSNSIT